MKIVINTILALVALAAFIFTVTKDGIVALAGLIIFQAAVITLVSRCTDWIKSY